MCSVHESNFINIPLLIPAFCLFAAGLGGKILGGMNLGVSFLQESQAVLDICLLHNRSLWRALRPVTQERLEVQPAWRVSASEGEKRSQNGIISQPGVVLRDTDRGSAATPTSLLGRSNVEVREEGRAGSSSK